MATSISSAEKPSIDDLKREAKRLKKRATADGRSVKHHEALNTVARDWGYLDYRHARAVLAPDEEEECA